MVAGQAPIDTTLWARITRWISRAAVSRRLALPLTAAALASGVLTYGALTGSMSLALGAHTVPVLLLVDLVLILLLCVVVLGALLHHEYTVRAFGNNRPGHNLGALSGFDRLGRPVARLNGLD